MSLNKMKDLSFDANNVHVTIDKVDVVKFTEANEPKPTPLCPFRKKSSYQDYRHVPCRAEDAIEIVERFELCMKEQCAAWSAMHECCKRI